MNRLVRMSDILILLAAAALSSQALPERYASPLPAGQVLLIALTQVLIFQFVMDRMQAYRLERYTDMLAASLHLVGGVLPAMVSSLLVLGAFVPETGQPLNYLAAWAALALLLLLISRQVQAVLLGSAIRDRLLHRRVVVIGANTAAQHAIGDLAECRRGESYEVVAIFRAPSDDPDIRSLGGIPVQDSLEDLKVFAQDNTIDVLVVALPWSRSTELFGLIEAVSWIAADIVIPLDGRAGTLDFARIAHLGNRPTLQVMSRPFKGSQGVLKVVEDYVLASIGLLVMAPVMLAVALAIRLDSPGPVLFRQARPGFGTKPFTIFKFRTMHVDPQDDATIGTTGPRDRRVTRVGAVLRRLSLDELPQLFNVLRGEMSIVGPRPYVANMLVGNERFSDLVRQYAARHRIKPGITGYAQAHGLRSFALRYESHARKSVEMDLHYMRHWSLWLDLKIILRTLATGLAGRNVF